MVAVFFRGGRRSFFSGQQRRRGVTAARVASPLVAFAAIAITLAACGGGGKPAYCSDLTNLQNDIKSLSSLSSLSSVSDLKSHATQIKDDATKLVNDAKGSFPSQSDALKESVNKFADTVKGLSSSPSTSQISAVATAAANVVSSVQNLANAVKSSCG